MRYLLDTNVCIAFLNGRDAAVRRRLLACDPEDVAICSIVKAELTFGARKSEHVAANLARLEEFFAPLQSLPFDDDAAQRYAVVRLQLARSGRLIGGNDMMISAIALAADLALVTRNVDEFRRVAGLRVETW